MGPRGTADWSLGGPIFCREQIVERHGSDIWADTEPGGGATLSFTLPADET